MRRMLITLMFSVAATKSRTFSSFPCSADEQVCRSWEGAQPGSQPKLASGNIPYNGHHARFTNRSWLGGRNSLLEKFNSPFSMSSNFFRKKMYCALFVWHILILLLLLLLLLLWLLFLSLLLLLLLLVVVLLLLFTLLFYQTVFISTQEFYFFLFSSPSHCRESKSQIL